MTATDELRRMLDERGVEWKAPNSCLRDEMTMWTAGGFDYEAFEVPEPDGTFLLTAANDDLTPEQVIAATLGETPTPPPPTPPKQPPYDELIESLRRDWDIEASWDGLRRFWYVGLTDEGVRKRDEREATLGRGECHEVIVDEYWRGCGNCGYMWEYMYGIGKCTRPNFCPRCGAKVVDA